MLANTVCMDTNSSPGPWPYSTPKAAQAGMMAIPASRATMESEATMNTALRCRFSFLLRNEP